MVRNEEIIKNRESWLFSPSWDIRNTSSMNELGEMPCLKNISMTKILDGKPESNSNDKILKGQ